MKVIRQSWVIKKGRWYYIDNGLDSVTEYMDEFDCSGLFGCSDYDFIRYCEDSF